MKNKLIIGIGFVVALSGCGSEAPKKEAEEINTEPKKELQCSYELDVESAEILWTAYKYNQKTGVKGSFGSFAVEGNAVSETKAGSLDGAAVSIDVTSIDSGDPTRDPKILEHFFGSLQNSSSIFGSIEKIDESSQSLMVAVTMNDTTIAVSAPYTIEASAIEAKMELNVNDWGGSEGIAALNEACEDLHKGSDGESILWPDVTVIIVAPFTESCQ